MTASEERMVAPMSDDREKVPPALSDLRRTETLGKAQARLLNRPRISIRLRFAASLAVCFFMCCAFALDTLVLMGGVRDGLVQLGTLSELSVRTGGAQVSERTLLAGGRDLEDADMSLYAAEALLRAEDKGLSKALPASDLRALSASIERQRRQIRVWRTLKAKGLESTEESTALVAAISTTGPQVTAQIEAMAKLVRSNLVQRLSLSENRPFLMLSIIFGLFLAVTLMHARALQTPIRRFQDYAKRIAQGDFELIHPARAYKDEFTDLALALNQMLSDLQATQQHCVEAGKLAAIGTITSGIAHEINNPLNNISLTTEALMEDFKTMSDEKKWNFLQDIYFETERASEIVKSLLDFTRTQTIERVPLDVGGVILSTQRLLQNEMVLNNVAFECDLPPDLPQVKGAANQLRQVFLNLFINAIHAMPRGGALRVKANLHEEERVCVEVQDQGEGIPPEVLPHVFDPFFTTKEPGKGTGLGLSVSLSIIKRHGGDIQVESEPGKGTTFHVCLPRADRA